MATFTARQATPGTKIVIAGSHPSGLMAPDQEGRLPVGPMLTTITVARWEGQGNGYAGLISTRGQWCGLFGPEDLFADTWAEATALWEDERRGR